MKANTTPLIPINTTSPTAPAKPRFIAKPAGSWKEAVGSMKDCDLFDAAMRAGEEWRAKMNREGR